MLNRIFRLYRTVRYLQLRQIIFQLRYRIKSRYLRIGGYSRYAHSSLENLNIGAHGLIPAEGKYQGRNTFTFLNLRHDFGSTIDWNFQQYGKLWNYNLQYFDYLHDPSIDEADKKFLIDSFAGQLLAGSVRPEPYPVSLRLINWLIFRSATGHLSPEADKALACQADYLRNNLEFHIQANHLLENYIALTLASVAIPDRQLVEQAGKGLVNELEKQVLPDGAHYECSPMYHMILLSRLVLVINATGGRKEFTQMNAALREKAAAMAGWLKAIRFSNGDIPYCNDAAPGIAPGAGILLEALKDAGIEPAVSSLNASGYRMFAGNGFELLADIGNITPDYQPGHAHCDMLAFILYYRQQPVFIDTGTSTYENNARRQYERSTAAHNTVTIQNDNQSEIWGSFRMAARAKIIEVTERPGSLTASHDGYLKKYNCIHTRSFDFDATAGNIRITDCIRPGANVEGKACFHLHTNVSVVSQGEKHIRLSNGLQLEFEHAVKIGKEACQYSEGFNKLQSGEKIVVHFSGELVTLLTATN